MAVLPIVKYGDPLLRKKAVLVTDIQAVPNLLDDMFETMYERDGMGLAANQVGLDMNFAIIDISHEEEDEYPRVIINPEIRESSGGDGPLNPRRCIRSPHLTDHWSGECWNNDEESFDIHADVH